MSKGETFRGGHPHWKSSVCAPNTVSLVICPDVKRFPVFEVPYLIVYFWSVESHIDGVRGGVMVWSQRWLLFWSVAHHKVHKCSRGLEHVIEHLVTSDISKLIMATTLSASGTVLLKFPLSLSTTLCGDRAPEPLLPLSGFDFWLMIPHVVIALEWDLDHNKNICIFLSVTNVTWGPLATPIWTCKEDKKETRIRKHQQLSCLQT